MAYPLSLDDALQMATRNDLVTQEARLTWLANKNDKGIAFSYLLPQLAVNQTASKSKTDFEYCAQGCQSSSNTYRLNQTYFSFSQELINMPSYYQYAKANQKALHDLLVYQQALQSMVLRVSSEYFNLILQIENLGFLQSELQETQQRKKDIQIQVSMGAMTAAQQQEATAQEKRVLADIIQTKILIENARDLLADSIGNYEFTHVKALQENASVLSRHLPKVSHWETRALKQNLQIQAAQNNIEQTRLQKKSTGSAFLPTLSLNASYTHNDYNTPSDQKVLNNALFSTPEDNRNTQGSISLSWPLITGAKRFYDHRKSADNHQLSQIQKQKIEQTTTRRIKKLHRQLKHDQELITARQAALKSSEEMLRISRISQNQGAITTLEVLENISNVRKDKQTLEEARYNHLLNFIDLLIQSNTISQQEVKKISQGLQQRLAL